jgi:hypothetical protein
LVILNKKQMLGYFFYGLTLLIVIGFTIFSASKPSLSGENGMGYGLGLAFFGLAFAISSLILTLYVGWKNGFDWVSNQNFNRNVLVGLGWACMAAAVFACGVFKWEWHEGDFPKFLDWFAKSNGQTWIPLLMLIPYFFLLNTETRASVSPNMYKIPLIIGFVLTIIISAALLFGWLRISAKQQAATLESRNEREISIRNDHLQTIANHKTEDNIIYLMALTGRFHDADIRAAAVAKVKEKPDWEDKLIELLNDKSYYAHAYTFIDGNAVEHPELFLKPLNNSILHMASEIQESITDSNNLQDWHFEHLGIERLFRAIDEQFLNKGMDFRPAMLKLQEALNTTPPERFKNVRFKETLLVKDWLKRH